MAHVDDLIQARAQKIALSAVTPLSRLHPTPSANHLCAERITKRICKESARPITFSGKSVPHRIAVSDSNSTASEIFTDDYDDSWYLGWSQVREPVRLEVYSGQQQDLVLSRRPDVRRAASGRPSARQQVPAELR
jgi:hypothetical protein